MTASSTSLGGNAFLVFIYGYIVFTGATMMADGGDLLADLNWSPAMIGGAPLAGLAGVTVSQAGAILLSAPVHAVSCLTQRSWHPCCC